MTQYRFEPPSVLEGPVSLTRLGMFYKIPQGITVIKHLDGTYEQGRYYQIVGENGITYVYLNGVKTQVAIVYPGGEVFTVNQAEATALTNAGYGSYLSAI